MAKAKKTTVSTKSKKIVEKEKSGRNHAITTMLNDVEFDAYKRYCKQFKVTNKSKMIREMILASMWKDFNGSYPTLFDKQELADLVIERR